MDGKKTAFSDFVEISKDTLSKLPKNIFVTEETDPAKAIPAMLDAVRGGGAVAAVWLHDYWKEEREMFRQLEQSGGIEIKSLQHGSGTWPLHMQFNDAALTDRQKLEARIRAREEELKRIALEHCDPNFCEYMIQGGQGKEFFDVRADENFHVDQSGNFVLSFIGAISGPGTWFVAPEDTAYYRDYQNQDPAKPVMTHGYLGNDRPTLYGVPQGALLLMPSGDGGARDGQWLLHTTPFALSLNGHEFKQGDKRIFERFTLSGPGENWAKGPKS